MVDQSKKCSRCGVYKHRSNFPKNKSKPDGLKQLCHDCNAAHAKECRLRRRWKVLSHYSGGIPECSRCGIQEMEFLTIDHERGDGAEHRKRIKDVYTWVIKNNYPSNFGLRVLCINCNWSSRDSNKFDFREVFDPGVGVQLCHKCNKVKSLNLFPRDSKSHTGFDRYRCKECHQIRSAKVRARRKVRTINHYGGKCFCCDESDVDVLTIDHINGRGKKHREQVGNVYAWIIKNNFPRGFRIACMNCNFSLGMYGYCPHASGSRMTTPPTCGPVFSPISMRKKLKIKQLLEEEKSMSEIARQLKVTRITVRSIKTGMTHE